MVEQAGDDVYEAIFKIIMCGDGHSCTIGFGIEM